MSLNTKASATDHKQGRRRFLLGLSWTGLSLFFSIVKLRFESVKE